MELGHQLLGISEAIRTLEEELSYAARSDAKVLITGESGVGKEVVARRIHSLSRRSSHPLVTINCAGVPDSLLESELFGHMRGSFTDAHRDKRGWLELAHNGTILLDEIGEMSVRMQALLLRFLETGEIQRVGSDRHHTSVNVRVIASTNRDLYQRIQTNEFREDLFYRLNVIHLKIPPLRERLDDVPGLLAYFLRVFSQAHNMPAPELSTEVLSMLSEYEWPGNVRELRNVVERLVVRARSRVIQPADLPVGIQLRDVGAARPAALAAPTPVGEALFARLVAGRESFWVVVYEPFMSRDLTRDDVRMLIRLGLERTRGSYKALLELFNMEAGHYKRFLSFLRKYQCHMPFQRFRAIALKAPLPIAPAETWNEQARTEDARRLKAAP